MHLMFTYIKSMNTDEIKESTNKYNGKNRCKRILDENLAQQIDAKKILGYCTEKKNKGGMKTKRVNYIKAQIYNY